MTAYKRYLKLKGYQFQEDYPCMPWDNWGRQRELLEESDCFINDNNELLIVEVWDVATVINKVERNGDIYTISFD